MISAGPNGPDLSGPWGRLTSVTVGAGPARSRVDWSAFMPTKKKPEPPWEVILEEIRSQNRATIEAVEVNRETLERRFDHLEGRSDRLEQRQDHLDASIVRVEKSLIGRMDDLERALTARMDALEKALAGVDQESRSRDASLEVAVRELKVSVQQNSVDLRELATKVEALTRLEERVAALERRSA